MQTDKVLSEGEWAALLFQCPTQVKPLAYRLAVHHGAVERPSPENCPLCGAHTDQPAQPLLDYGAGAPK